VTERTTTRIFGHDLAIAEEGSGRVIRLPDRVRLLRPGATVDVYSNAQIGDPAGWRRRRPPLTMTVRARFGHPVAELRGTAGFGFWNAALGPGIRGLRLPRAAWFFFGGPPYDVPLVLDVPGNGFKAMTLDALRPAFVALLPTAPLALALLRVPGLYRRLWPIAQRAFAASEASLDGLDVTVPRDYALRWEPGRATFAVDGQTVLVAPAPPPGPLFFTAWIDNSYAIATPRGRFAMGTIAKPEPQWLEIERLTIEE
jgi:hypothetical protein